MQSTYQCDFKRQAWRVLLCKFNFDSLSTRCWFHCSCQVIWHQLKIDIICFILSFNAILLKEIALKKKKKNFSVSLSIFGKLWVTNFHNLKLNVDYHLGKLVMLEAEAKQLFFHWLTSRKIWVTLGRINKLQEVCNLVETNICRPMTRNRHKRRVHLCTFEQLGLGW